MMSHARPKISSQVTENLVLDDCKDASLARNKGSFLTEPLVSTKDKVTANTLLSLRLGGFEDVLMNICSILFCQTLGLFGVQRPVFRF
jgi:hypothetical protein